MRPLLALPLLVLFGVSPTPSSEAKLVEYDVDGTTKYANTTWNNGAGSMEQKQIRLPFHESFIAPAGTLAYISAQKVKVLSAPRLNGSVDVLSDGVAGTVHVILHINSQLAGEATADAPFGIAKASGKVD